MQTSSPPLTLIEPVRQTPEWGAYDVVVLGGGPVDATDAAQLSDAEVEGRLQIVDFFGFPRESAPGFENAYILEVAPQVGIRETRRIVDEYQLGEANVVQCARFDDTVGVNSWMIAELAWRFVPACGRVI